MFVPNMRYHPGMNQWDMRDILNSLDDKKRYAPTSRDYGLIMESNRQKKHSILTAARAKARKK